MSEINRNIVELFMNKHGMDISMFDESFVNKTILQRIEFTGCSDLSDYSRFVAENEKEATLFTGLFQVSHSEFFRNQLTFSVLESIVLPEMVFLKKNNNSKEIRIWSAACAGGHESYSLAMILENLIGDNEKMRYRVFGTDRDEKQVNIALSGVYTQESVGNVTQKQFKKWFVRSGNLCAVIPELKKHIKFSVFDLLSKHSTPPESIYGDFDLVLCANILFYYKPGVQKVILEKVSDSLAEGGLLITGETEREILKAGKFKEVYPQSAIFRKKIKE
ncbi:MAG: CheR family methyltransferase [Bacteroidales bacterium]|nr:CheR family methyltransferase [Bacteroidales bacterium]